MGKKENNRFASLSPDKFKEIESTFSLKDSLFQQSAFFLNNKILFLNEKIDKLKNNFQFDDEVFNLELQILHLIKKSEWEQKEFKLFQTEVNEYNNIKTSLIYKNLANNLSSKTPPSGQK